MRFVEVDNGTLLNADNISAISGYSIPGVNGPYNCKVCIKFVDRDYQYNFAKFRSAQDETKRIKEIMTALARWLNLPESESCRHTIARYDGADGVEEVK